MNVPSTLVMPFLPKETHLKIALFSDFHLGPYKGKKWIEKVVSHVNKQNPDLILIVGDFIFEDDSQENVINLLELKNLFAPLGIFAVLGNHDYGE